MKKKDKHNEYKGSVFVRSDFIKKDQMRLSYNNAQTHSLVIGTTGSGKAQSYILPSILSIADSDASMVINDPKGELCQKISEYLKRKGYRVFVMDYFQPLAETCGYCQSCSYWLFCGCQSIELSCNEKHPICKPDL